MLGGGVLSLIRRAESVVCFLLSLVSAVQNSTVIPAQSFNRRRREMYCYHLFSRSRRYLLDCPKDTLKSTVVGRMESEPTHDTCSFQPQTHVRGERRHLSHNEAHRFADSCLKSNNKRNQKVWSSNLIRCRASFRKRKSARVRGQAGVWPSRPL